MPLARAALLALLLLPAGCALTPDYERPPLEVPEAFEQGGAIVGLATLGGFLAALTVKVI